MQTYHALQETGTIAILRGWSCIQAMPLVQALYAGGIRMAEVLADTMPFMLSAAAVMVVTHLATHAIPNLALLLLSRIVIASLLYLAIMKIAKVEILNECLRFVRKKK